MFMRRLLALAAALGCAVPALAAGPTPPSLSTPFINENVRVLAAHEGIIYVGGSFTEAGGLPREGLAAFDPQTGEVDPFWNPRLEYVPPFFAATVLDIAIAQNRVYVAGFFETANAGFNPTTRQRIAAFELANGSNVGVVDPDWAPVLSGGSLGVPRAYSLAASRDETVIYLGGSYNTITTASGSALRGNLAALDSITGQVDPAWNPDLLIYILPLGDLTQVTELTTANGKVFAGGTFKEANAGSSPVAVYGSAAFGEADGSDTGALHAQWQPGLNDSIRAFAYDEETRLLYGVGLFASYKIGASDPVPLGGLGAFDPEEGKPFPGWNPDLADDDKPASLFAVAVGHGRVFAGGGFNRVNVSYGAIPRTSLAAFFPPTQNQPLGLVDRGFAPLLANGGEKAFVTAILPFGKGVIVGGNFLEVDGEPVENLAYIEVPPLVGPMAGASGLMAR
jgi:hypothetical protein